MNTPDYFYCETKRTLGSSSRESRRGRGKSHIRLSSRFWSLSLSAARTLGDFLFWYPRMLTTFSTLPDLCPLSVRVSAQCRDLYSRPPTDSADSSLYLNRIDQMTSSSRQLYQRSPIHSTLWIGEIPWFSRFTPPYESAIMFSSHQPSRSCRLIRRY